MNDVLFFSEHFILADAECLPLHHMILLYAIALWMISKIVTQHIPL